MTMSENNQFHRLVIPDGGFKTIIDRGEFHASREYALELADILLEELQTW